MREKIAALEHEQWIQWAKTLIEKEELSLERVNRWKQLFVLYSELSEEMKDFDREWADKVLSLPSGYIAGSHEITVQEKLDMCDRMFLLVREMSQINEDQVSGNRGLLKNVEVWSWLARAEDMLTFNGERIIKKPIPPSEGK